MVLLYAKPYAPEIAGVVGRTYDSDSVIALKRTGVCRHECARQACAESNLHRCSRFPFVCLLLGTASLMPLL